MTSLNQSPKSVKSSQKEEENRAKSQAKAQLNSIVEMIEAYHKAQDGDEADFEGHMLDADSVAERIQEDPLCVEIRTGWHVNAGVKVQRLPG